MGSGIPRIHRATIAHCDLLAPKMRPEDVAEVLAQGLESPLSALQYSVKVTRDPEYAEIDGEPIAMWGVVDHDLVTGTGIPWLLTGVGLLDHVRTFQRGAMAYLRWYKRRYRVLVNYVDVRNERAVRWCRHAGFEMHGPVPYGPDQLPFWRAEWRADWARRVA